ncbi:uncharacterized protein [Ptychodera flava]|uniref:uncharacterized protein n=1 Tax=Ptychodera flava TaxID=63121 RepID=UPI00396AAC5D
MLLLNRGRTCALLRFMTVVILLQSLISVIGTFGDGDHCFPSKRTISSNETDIKTLTCTSCGIIPEFCLPCPPGMNCTEPCLPTTTVMPTTTQITTEITTEITTQITTEKSTSKSETEAVTSELTSLGATSDVIATTNRDQTSEKVSTSAARPTTAETTASLTVAPTAKQTTETESRTGMKTTTVTTLPHTSQSDDIATPTVVTSTEQDEDDGGLDINEIITIAAVIGAVVLTTITSIIVYRYYRWRKLNSAKKSNSKEGLHLYDTLDVTPENSLKKQVTSIAVGPSLRRSSVANQRAEQKSDKHNKKKPKETDKKNKKKGKAKDENGVNMSNISDYEDSIFNRSNPQPLYITRQNSTYSDMYSNRPRRVIPNTDSNWQFGRGSSYTWQNATQNQGLFSSAYRTPRPDYYSTDRDRYTSGAMASNSAMSGRRAPYQRSESTQSSDFGGDDGMYSNRNPRYNRNRGYGRAPGRLYSV